MIQLGYDVKNTSLSSISSSKEENKEEDESNSE
jgi:hypothetical protein